MSRRLRVVLAGLGRTASAIALGCLGAIVGVVAPSEPSGAVTYPFGAEPLVDLVTVTNAMAGAPCANGLATPNRIAAIAIVAAQQETVVNSSLTPSPMTLHRHDTYQLNSQYQSLYSFNTVSSHERAFYHAGVGLWGLTSLDDSDRLSEWQRINTQSASFVVAPLFWRQYCDSSATTSTGRLQDAWQNWSCGLNSLIATCQARFNTIYNQATDSVQNIVFDGSVTRTGGMVAKRCKNGTSGNPYTCYLIDPALAQGYTSNWGTPYPPLTGEPSGGDPSPLACRTINFDKVRADQSHVGDEYHHEYWFHGQSGCHATTDVGRLLWDPADPWDSVNFSATNLCVEWSSGNWTCY